MDGPTRIVVIGASAGGVEALTQLARDLPKDLRAAIFIVLHMGPESPSVLPMILDRAGPMPAAHAVDHEPIRAGRVYVARPNLHLIVRPGHVRLLHTPKENRHRPAVDPLFRSAARAYGPAVVGVVLTGALDDGTAGLLAVKAQGGVAVVQSPNDALCAGMPQSALDHVAIDHCLPLAEIPRLLVELASRPIAPEKAPGEEAMFIEEQDGHEDEQPDAKPSAFTCPECHGTLFERTDSEVLQFRCRIGHAFSAESLLAEMDVALEGALWTAVRSLEESAAAERKIAAYAAKSTHSRTAIRHEQSAEDKEKQAAMIRDLLLKNGNGAKG